MWPTPRANKPEGYSSDGFRPTLAQCVTGEQKPRHGQLNADWVECLMNFPIDWTSQDDPQEWPGWPAPLGIKMWRSPDASCGARGANSAEQYNLCVDTNVSSVKLNSQVVHEQIDQYDYEPPRVTTGQKDRAKRLKALGNAVVPLQIKPIFDAIVQLERRHTHV